MAKWCLGYQKEINSVVPFVQSFQHHRKVLILATHLHVARVNDQVYRFVVQLIVLIQVGNAIILFYL